MSDDPRETVEGGTNFRLTEELAGPARGPRRRVKILPGTHIGRYRVIEELGAGTMGVVYAAEDPELDRKVALKLLKSRSDEQAGSRVRLQREAKALARLNHRNVVGVYDVGVHLDRLFLAMEFVKGETLRDWMESRPQPRPWAEVLRVLAEAGRGLEAAHSAGFVHRDFKPDNVMLDERGRVKVMDFGLARAEIHEPEGDSSGSEGSINSSVELEVLRKFPTFAGPLTQTGTVMGTPGYMARELFQGRPADARSDQFAFCVSLYEALYGERPYPGRTMVQLLESVAKGRINPPPRTVRVPGWLRKLVLRGLSGDPEQRWPSILALLEAIDTGPGKQRRRWFGGLGLGGLVLVGGSMLAQRVQEAQVCEETSAEVRELWNDERRAALHDRFTHSKVSYAADAWERVERGLDDYAAQWGQARGLACEARREGSQTQAELDLRVDCLAGRLQHLRATAEVLAHADASIVARSVEMVAQLPRIDACEDVESLLIHAAPRGELAHAERVVSLEQRLIDAEALEKAGKYAPALALCAAIGHAAKGLEHEHLLARVRLRQGALQRRAGNYEAAHAMLLEAYELAAGLRMSTEAAEAAARLVFVVGYQLARPDEGRQWALHAKALARAAGTDEAQALYFNNIGAVVYAEAKYDEARGYWEGALAMRERALGEGHPTVAGSLNNLGVLAHVEGEFEAARGYHERALAIWTEAFGPEHPQTSYSLNHLGRVAREQGRYGKARRYHQDALGIRERALGPRHSLVADTLTSLGELFEAEGQHERALVHHQRAIAIYEVALGPEHPVLANALTEQGRALIMLERKPEAVAVLERALDIHSLAEGNPTDLAKTRFALARALTENSRSARARALAMLAAKGYAEDGKKSQIALADVEAWLGAS